MEPNAAPTNPVVETPDFSSVRTFILFVGYPRSGHSLIGSIMDAHPNIIIAHEYDVVGKLESYMSDDGRERLYNDLFQDSRAMAFREGGRQHNNYNYAVPGQWQGTYRDRLEIIGDKKGGTTAAILARKPEELNRVRDLVKVPIKLIHVIRNPFDAMATHTKRKGDTSSDSEWFRKFMQRFEAQTATVGALKQRASEYPMFDLRSDEDMITDPQGTLKRLFDFLEVPHTDEFIATCASIVYAKPHKSRHEFEWRDEEKKQIADLIAKTEWFSGYSFDS